jgi:hypothetical protein
VADTSSTESTGSWWVPGNRDAAVKGTLTIDERGRAVLVTTDIVTNSWFPAGVDPNDQVVSLPAVHGEVDGQAVTLLNCKVYTLFLNVGSIEVLAGAVLDGLWVDDSSHRVLTEAVVKLEHLSAWTKRPATPSTPLDPRQPHAAAPVGLANSVELASADVGIRTLSVRWAHEYARRFTNMGWVTTLYEQASFRIRYRELADMETVNGDVRALQDLISFATGKVSAVTLLRVSATNATDVAAPNTPPVALVHRRRVLMPNPDGRPIASSEMAFTLEDFDFADFMPRWFAHHHKFQPVFATLLGHRYAPTQFLENQALDAIAAAEQTYRIVGMPEFFMNERLASKARKKIREALSSDPALQEFAEQIAAPVDGRVTLDERLRKLASRLGTVATKVFGDEDGFEWWLQAAKRSRNDIAHTGSTSRYGGEALGAIADGAKALVELILFAELGLSDDQLLHIVAQHYGLTAEQITSTLSPPTTSDN